MILKESKKFILSAAMLVGMIIGVGIFGIPFVLSRAGFWPGIFYFVVLGAAIILVHLFYGETVLRTNGRHRLVGYADKYLGIWGKRVAGITEILGMYGSIIAYIIVGGEFLFSLVRVGDVFIYQIFVFLAVAVFVLFGLKLLSWIEFVLTAALLVSVVTILFLAAPVVRPESFFAFDPRNIFLPYGVILFSLGGSAAIPEIKEVLRGSLKKMKNVLIAGSLIAILITAAFGFLMWGVSGSGTSEETLVGLQGILSQPILALGAVFGFLCIITSFLVIGINLKEIFFYDYNLKNNVLAWALAVLAPFFIFLFGTRTFIDIISITGALFGGMNGIIIVLIYLKSKTRGDKKPEYILNLPKFIPYSVMILFIVGIIYEIFYLLS
jgi:amino acid permease